MKFEDIKVGDKLRVVKWEDGESRNAHLGEIVTVKNIAPRGCENPILWIEPVSVVKQKAVAEKQLMPADSKEREDIPIATGVLDYFTSALIEIAKVSKAGNDQHNPGEPLGWSRKKSTDHANKIIRHFLERGGLDTDGTRHSAKLAWRALALLQQELEDEGAPVSRGSK